MTPKSSKDTSADDQIDEFACYECLQTEFKIEVKEMVGSDGDFIDAIVCSGCGKRYRDVMRPTQIVES